jgi:murein DD-endopeptidase MepM/ murein hydrolase activator NlpD
MPISPTATVQLSRQKNDGFTAKKIDAPVEHKLARAGGTIDSSIYETGVSSGLPPALLSEIISAYSYDVDFQRDIKQGDSMDVLFERTQTKDGVATGHGNIIFAELDLGDRELKIYRYVDKSGSSDYYNEHGESIRKALLRTPINGAHITSGYGMRMHPLLGYSKMHRGIDFGAPLGTPIYAAGDGTVDFIGRKGGYGNFLKIKHNAKYASGYGHISRFASGLTPGSKVKQGQIIAYVGSTGMSTGPHLHYEIMINDEQVNPSNVKFKNGNVLQGRELAAFRRNVEQIQANLNATPHNKTDVAMADTGRKKTQAED